MSKKPAAPLPCPFCGTDEPDWCDESGGDWHFIQCRDCEATTGHHYKSKDEAVVAWNRRARRQDAY